MSAEQQGGEPVPAQDFGGYPTLDALLQAKRASGDEAKKWRQHAEMLEQQLQQSQRPDIPQRQQSPYERLQEYGVPPEPIKEAIDFEVRQRIQEAFDPIVKGFAAKNQILTKYPDYSKFEADVAQYVSSDPDTMQRYQKLWQADPESAMEWSILKYGAQKKQETQSQVDLAAQAQAQIPSTRSGDSRGVGANEQDMIRDAFEKFKKGDIDASTYAKLRLRQGIPDQFYGG